MTLLTDYRTHLQYTYRNQSISSIYSMAAAPAAAAPLTPMPKEFEVTPDSVTFNCGNAGKVRYLGITVDGRSMNDLFCVAVNVLRHQNGQQGSQASVLQGDLPSPTVPYIHTSTISRMAVPQYLPYPTSTVTPSHLRFAAHQPTCSECSLQLDSCLRAEI